MKPRVGPAVRDEHHAPIASCVASCEPASATRTPARRDSASAPSADEMPSSTSPIRRARLAACTPTTTSTDPAASSASRLAAEKRSTAAGASLTAPNASRGQAGQHGEVVPEVARDQKRSPHVFAPRAAQSGGELGVFEELPDPKRGALDGRHGKPGHLVDDLRRNAPREAADHRLALPHGLRDRQPEVLA